MTDKRPSPEAMEWFHKNKRDFGLPRGGEMDGFSENIAKALDAFAASRVAEELGKTQRLATKEQIRIWRDEVENAVKAEREACAVLVEVGDLPPVVGGWETHEVEEMFRGTAQAIRARGGR